MGLLSRLALAAALASGAAAASAHTGHGTEGFASGLAHPLALDHLLAMLAVGVWSAVALDGGRRLAGPAVFLLTLLAGAAVGVLSGASPAVDAGIAASVVVFGALLAAPKSWSPLLGLALIGAGGSLHGLAHGAEMPSSSAFGLYAAGFVLTTAALHLGGFTLGRVMAAARAWVWRAAAAGLAGTGVVLLARI